MPRRSVASLPVLLVALAQLFGCGSSDNGVAPGGGGTGGTGEPPDTSPYMKAPKSCAYVCGAPCKENTTPYACPAMAAWKDLPHDEACVAWDGNPPVSKPGTCKATEPKDDAIKRPGEDAQHPGARILPDGHTIRPAGVYASFNEADVQGGLTSNVISIPGTAFVLAVDTGGDDNAVRAIDTSKIGSVGAVSSYVKFPRSSNINSGIAFVPPDRAFLSTDYGVVQKLTFDTSTGLLTSDDAGSLVLPKSRDISGNSDNWYVASVAANPAGTRLVVASVQETRALVFDIDPASAAYGTQLGEVDLGAKEHFGVWFDPLDTAGSRAYVSAWGSKKVLEIDLGNPAAPALSRTFATERDPQGIAFLDARWMAVANDLGETITLVDRSTGTVTSVPIDFEPGRKGLDVSSIAYDSSAKRLYATLAGVNAVAAYDVDLAKSPPTLTPAGRLPTAWWPSGLALHEDGSLTVASLRGVGIGPYLETFTTGDGSGHQNMHGGIQHVANPSIADLQDGDTFVRASAQVGARAGYPTVDCGGAASDFPVPATNTEGASPVIKNIIYIVRENKSFDALFGDMPNLEGDPKYAFKTSSAEMDKVWLNFRNLARTFAISDNFYNVAVQSVQGHTWTTYGRTTDYDERTWGDDSRWAPLSGIDDVGRPEEGSLFDWLQNNGVVYDILGEVVGIPREVPSSHNPIDPKYPGGPFQNITYNDLEKACYTAARMRVACNLGSFVFMTLPNDHTVGVSPTNPSPETMCAVNDEATGIVIDAVSHSPQWGSTLIIVTEDDPQQGGDHVDYHRTPVVFVSPWVKRGYVSKAHIDVASLHKLFAHVYGKPYSNLIVANAGLPLDLFTSTPDYTPYSYAQRAWTAECGKDATRAERTLTESWDFKNVDEAPGLGEQVMRWMRGRQMTEITPGLAEAIRVRRMNAEARGVRDD